MISPIAVVGGSYAEECAFPRSWVSRGIGMRAACILSGLANPTIFHTSIGPTLGSEFEDIAKRKGIELKSTAGSVDIWFRYRHPLGRPDIYPASVPQITAPENIVTDHALVFGMMEGRPKVDAKRVVYDPQDGF